MTAMINLSMAEAMRLYGELTEALYNVNGFGGNVAELYMYRFGLDKQYADSTFVSVFAEDARREANEALHDFLAFFIDNHSPNVAVYIECEGGWSRFGAWVREARFDHRVHVRVERKK